MIALQEYRHALSVAHYHNPMRYMKTDAGKAAFAQTGTMELRSPCSKTKHLFIENYRSASSICDLKIKDHFTELQAIFD